ncbi:chaperone modulator CbpM [Mesorhizobium denitrificans]
MRMSKHQLAKSAGIRSETLDVWITQEWLVPDPTSGAAQFTDIDAARVRLILELKNDLGANDEGIAVILHLMDQLHGMRRALARMKEEMQRPPD